MPGLKTGVENDVLWSEIGSEFGEPDRPTKNVLEGLTGKKMTATQNKSFKVSELSVSGFQVL